MYHYNPFKQFPIPFGPPHFSHGGRFAPDEGGVEPLPASNLNRLQPMKPLVDFMARGGKKKKMPVEDDDEHPPVDIVFEDEFPDLKADEEDPFDPYAAMEHEYKAKKKKGLAPGPDYEWDDEEEKWVPKHLAYSHTHYQAPITTRKLTARERRAQERELKTNPLYRPSPKGPIGAGLYAHGGVISLPASNLDRLLPMKRKGGKIAC